ncbi:hypothetical protein BDV10DRAFT_21545 [Aspergillus recurvatus]
MWQRLFMRHGAAVRGCACVRRSVWCSGSHLVVHVRCAQVRPVNRADAVRPFTDGELPCIQESRGLKCAASSPVECNNPPWSG